MTLQNRLANLKKGEASPIASIDVIGKTAEKAEQRMKKGTLASIDTRVKTAEKAEQRLIEAGKLGRDIQLGVASIEATPETLFRKRKRKNEYRGSIKVSQICETIDVLPAPHILAFGTEV